MAQCESPAGARRWLGGGGGGERPSLLTLTSGDHAGRGGAGGHDIYCRDRGLLPEAWEMSPLYLHSSHDKEALFSSRSQPAPRVITGSTVLANEGGVYSPDEHSMIEPPAA